MATVVVPSPMAGAVKEVLVAVGDVVTEGQELVILESMKMEIPVESPAAGTVREVHVEPPQTVDEDQPLVTLG
ncbi:MAG: acetyl-CoA carboxylase biotin carboxyl carrier protein subunit [Dehalococcoidia bacterium]